MYRFWEEMISQLYQIIEFGGGLSRKLECYLVWPEKFTLEDFLRRPEGFRLLRAEPLPGHALSLEN